MSFCFWVDIAKTSKGLQLLAKIEKQSIFKLLLSHFDGAAFARGASPVVTLHSHGPHTRLRRWGVRLLHVISISKE